MFGTRNIKYHYLKLVRKVRNFLLSDKSREILIFFFFFIISTGFWLLQTLKNDYETDFSIPLRLKGIPTDVVITSELPKALKITVKDKGTVLLNYILGQSFYPINIDFSDYKKQNGHVKILARDLEKIIQSQLSTSTRLISIKPDTIEYIYTRGRAKKIPVKLKGRLTAGKQYYISDTLFSPDSVIAYAPKNILDTLKAAYTQYVNIGNIVDTTKQNVLLAEVKGAKFIPSNVNLTLAADIYTEKTVEVLLAGIDFPADKVLRTFPSKVKITFQIGLSKFKTIRAEDFLLTIPYEELLNNNSDKYRLKFKSLPTEVNHVRIVPSQVDFLIEQIPNHEY